jgi:bifunctional non-homologous end joining protein LigD
VPPFPTRILGGGVLERCMLRTRTVPTGFIEPCLPTKADTLPSGGLWLDDIKHDGFRIIARKNGAQVKLYSRAGNDLAGRFPLIVETLANLRTRSCIIDGEARSGRSPDWLKMKNSNAPAVKREAEEDWGR